MTEEDEELGELIDDLEDLHGLYKVLLKQRSERGAIDFDSTEVHFDIAEDGRVNAIVPRTRNTAHRMIEECMLCANVCAAKLVGRQSLPGLFRVHEPPEAEKLEVLSGFLERFGIKASFSSPVAAADYQQVVNQLRRLDNGHVLQVSLLRSMNQAVYQVENKGHFGLGFSEYTHFTSPIRRYPDLLTHRLIKTCIYDRNDVPGTLRLGRPKKGMYPYDMEDMVTLGEQTSFTERRADQAVYDVLEWLKCDHISHRVGDVLPGVITGVTKFGLFVELTDLFVEGLVHVSTLAGDYYEYDQETQCLCGQRTHTVYGMGDRVEVQVVRVNVDERKVDFEITSHNPLIKSRRKSASKSAKKQSKSRERDDSKGQPKAERKGGRSRRRRRGGKDKKA